MSTFKLFAIKNVSTTLKASIYILCIYILYLYLHEILIESGIGIELPQSVFMAAIDGFLIMVGGLFLGGLLIIIGGRWNKRFGVIMILANVLIGGYLLMGALV